MGGADGRDGGGGLTTSNSKTRDVVALSHAKASRSALEGISVIYHGLNDRTLVGTSLDND